MPAATVFASTPRVGLDGRESEALSAGLVRLRVEEDTAGLCRCEAAFGNWGPVDGGTGFLYLDRKVLEFGRQLRIALGPPPAGQVFDGRISAIEADFGDGRPPEVAVLAEDRFQDLRMTRRTRTFADLSDADVAGRIAGEHGLRADLDAPGPTHRVLAQLNQSDLAFLRDRALAIDAEAWVDGDSLGFRARQRREGAPLTLRYGTELRELTLLADLAGQRSSLAVTCWDVAAKSAIREEATAAAIEPELKGGQSGAATLEAAFGPRPEAVAHSVPLSASESRARAEALFRQRARRFLRGRGVAEGNPQLRVGATIALEGVSPLLEGEFYVAAVSHVYDREAGLRTEFEVERPALGAMA
jgi:phage protein D